VHKKTVTINNKLGLHARAAAKFVQSRPVLPVKSLWPSIIKDQWQSIMGVMMLAPAKDRY